MQFALGESDPCWCGSGKRYRRCHMNDDPPSNTRLRPGTISSTLEVPREIVRPAYVGTGLAQTRPAQVVKTPEQIEGMRRACRAAAEVLSTLGAAVAAGATTDELDRIAHGEYLKRGGYPSTLGYQGYPKSICTSINEVICHGIPDDRKLEEGDIVNCDVTIFLDGFHGDCSATFAVGDIDEESTRLMSVTRECLDLGIAAVQPGKPVNEIGRAIERHAIAAGFGVVRAFTGHGIGEVFHMDPQVPHYFEPRASDIMVPGMTFTIEPMITVGTWRHVTWPDAWTAVTADGRRTAQYEHTVLVTEAGSEVLTSL